MVKIHKGQDETAVNRNVCSSLFLYLKKLLYFSLLPCYNATKLAERKQGDVYEKKIIASLLCLTMVFSMTACGGKNSDSDVDYIKDKGTLVVGITDFEPMDYKDDSGEWVGFDADMAKMVGESLGVDVEFVEIDWDNKIMELKSKNIDVVWNGMTLTDEVKNSMECTNAYCSNGQVIVTADESKLDDPSKLTFAVEAGSAGEAVAEERRIQCQFRSIAGRCPDGKLHLVHRMRQIIDLLMASAMIGEGTSYPDLIHSDETDFRRVWSRMP